MPSSHSEDHEAENAPSERTPEPDTTTSSDTGSGAETPAAAEPSEAAVPVATSTDEPDTPAEPSSVEPLPPEPVAPSREDSFVRFASGFIGGPFGAHAVNPARRRFWTPMRIILLTALIVFGLSWIQKFPCAAGGWQDWNQYTQACYTDIRALWGAEKLDQGAVPYRDHDVEYPVLTGWFMGVLGQIAFRIENVFGVNGGGLFYHLNAITLFAFGLIAVAVLFAIRNTANTPNLRAFSETGPRPRPWDAMMLAAAPVMVVTASVNWDLFAVALAMPFFLYWQRGRPILAGLFLGLAVAAKFYALLFAGPLLILAFRAGLKAGPGGRFDPAPLLRAAASIATAAVVWAVINAPVAALWPDSWLRFFRLNSERPVDWGTGWYVLRDLTGWGALWDPSFVNRAYLVAFAVACLGIAALGLLAPKTPGMIGALAGPRLSQLCFLVVAAFLLTGKVWSQQYVLWLIPLIILARPKWMMFLVWQAAEIGYFIAFYGKMLQVSTVNDAMPRGIPEWLFVSAAAARWLAVAALCLLVVLDILNPKSDPVRYPRDLPTPAAPARRPLATSDPAPVASP
jgi:uncharacterized membrane protein